VLFEKHLVVVRGGGDLGTGAVARLHRAGFPVIVLELERPLTIRRTVSVSTAVTAGDFGVEDLEAVRVESIQEAIEATAAGRIPVLVSPFLPKLPEVASVLVDARLAKRNIDTTINDAELVVGLGPGFTAGEDCHAVVETRRGHHLGRVLWTGAAADNTGIPGAIGGESASRVVRSARSGPLVWTAVIGEVVAAGDALGSIDGAPIQSQIDGVVRGLLAEGIVSPGLKIADVDPRADRSACFEISDKSLAVGGGVLEAVLAWMNSATP
jgi:xanthine dehydrogenase accessory factor